jgi:D-methionine transport system substrate-binding protein
MKTIKIMTAVFAVAMLAACNGNGGGNSASRTPIEVSIAGTIDHTTHTPGQSGSVTFSRFPASVDEFKAVREEIGGEPHGAVALQLMAYEMYRRDRRVGLECIKLNNTTNNITSATDRLNQLFGNDATYARPYQIAAFLKGATWENGYNPSKPYTVEVKVNDGRPYDNSSDYQAPVLYLEVLTKGKDHGSETLYVLKTAKPGQPGEGKYFIVNNCPGVYAQVKEKSFSVEFNGLD